VQVKGKPGINSYAQALQAGGSLSAQDVKDITAWAGQRNEAAHGEFAKLSPERAQIMIDGINLFMRQKASNA
jgi:pheromone shutdown protein TraB